MALNELLSSVGDDEYFSDAFNKLIEDHLTELRTKNVQITDITNAQCAKYTGDFYGLLIDLQIKKVHHYPVLRVNGYLSPADFKGAYNQVILPDFVFIDRLKNTLQTE